MEELKKIVALEKVSSKQMHFSFVVYQNTLEIQLAVLNGIRHSSILPM